MRNFSNLKIVHEEVYYEYPSSETDGKKRDFNAMFLLPYLYSSWWRTMKCLTLSHQHI